MSKSASSRRHDPGPDPGPIGIKTVETKIQSGLLYSFEQKERVRDLLDWLTSVFHTNDIAALTGMSASSISHAKNRSARTRLRGVIDGIGKLFVEKLSQAIRLPEDEILSGAASWPDRRNRITAKLSLSVKPRDTPTPIKPRKPVLARSTSIRPPTPKGAASRIHMNAGRKSHESKIARGACYSEAQKVHVRAVVEKATAQFGVSGLASLMGIERARVSHAMHAKKHGRRDRIGPLFVKTLADVLQLKAADILSGAAVF